MNFDVIVIGGGAAGLMCAIEAGKRGRKVAVLEHRERVGKKILISGGGRCNFTNLHCSSRNFICGNPHFCKSALARYSPREFIGLVEKHGIRYHEKTLGQLFCDGSAHQVVEMLLEECRRAGVEVITHCVAQNVRKNDLFTVTTTTGEWHAQSVVIATGGLSIPKMGATDFGYRVARDFGLDLVPCRPALVPLVWNAEDRQRYCNLSGVSTEAIASCRKSHFREKLLFTHLGLSGPAILQISSYWNDGDVIAVDLAPDFDLASDLLERKRGGDQSLLKTALAERLPRRLAEQFAPLGKLADLRDTNLQKLASELRHWTLTPAGTEGYGKAEVTAGGVDTAELSSQTMESKRVPGLYFIGEVVDVTGHLGGFNFQWAWASGYCAGQHV